MSNLAVKNTTIGSDVEGFLSLSVKPNGRHVFKSAIDYIPGSKIMPFPVTNGFIQHDGVLAEWNSKPAGTRDNWILNNLSIVEELQEFVSPMEMEIVLESSATLADSEFTDPQARIGGCDPDFDAWTGKVNPKPNMTATNLRTCGGHVHVCSPVLIDPSNGRLYEYAPLAFIRVLDTLLGVPSILLDTDKERRKLYGKAGAFRYKNPPEDAYTGVEYRVLSNFWVKSPELIGWVFDSVMLAVENFDSYVDRVSSNVRDIINTGDEKAAREYIFRHIDLYPQSLFSLI